MRSQQIGPQHAIAYPEQIWVRELSSCDPGGPLPDIAPAVEEASETRRSWRTSRADATFSGSCMEVADTLARYARTGAVDGFNISPWLVPNGPDDMVDHQAPALQNRCLYSREYAGHTLREHLGLPVPAAVPTSSSPSPTPHHF